jgi:hypothetical protein
MGLAETMEQVARGVEVVGIATLVLGLVVALIQAARVLIGVKEQRRPTGSSGSSVYRRDLLVACFTSTGKLHECACAPYALFPTRPTAGR